MICRIWHGWTTTENSRLYEEIVRGEVIPAIEARRIPGFLSIDLVRRPVPEGFEFATIMWFADIDSVKAFVGEDYELAHVPERARNVLTHFDATSIHFEVLDRRTQRTSTYATGDDFGGAAIEGSPTPGRIGFVAANREGADA